MQNMSEGVQPVGDLVDAMGVQGSFDEGEIVTDAVVILKVLPTQGKPYLKVLWPEDIDWMLRRGMLEHACDMEKTIRSYAEWDEHDD